MEVHMGFSSVVEVPHGFLFSGGGSSCMGFCSVVEDTFECITASVWSWWSDVEPAQLPHSCSEKTNPMNARLCKVSFEVAWATLQFAALCSLPLTSLTCSLATSENTHKTVNILRKFCRMISSASCPAKSELRSKPTLHWLHSITLRLLGGEEGGRGGQGPCVHGVINIP